MDNKKHVKKCVEEILEKAKYLNDMLNEDASPKSIEELKDMAYKNKDEEEAEAKDKSDAV